MVRTNRSAYAFARGERIGVRMVSTPIEADTSSKLAVNLVSRSQMRNLNLRPASSRSEAKLRATWVTHGPFGLVVTPRTLSLIHISEPTRQAEISYAVI